MSSPAIGRHTDRQTEKFHYEAIEVSVPTTGNDLFTESSPIHMAAHLHDADFDLSGNRISQDLKSDGPEQFRMTASLQPGHRYVLIVGPQTPETTGTFSIVLSGPAVVSFRSVSTAPTRSTGEYRFIELHEEVPPVIIDSAL